jgi:uncharacterized protein (TIGR04255 family)
MSSTDITFRNAPLLEIVADLRWQPTNQTLSVALPPGSQAVLPVFYEPSRIENFIHRFGSEVYKYNFQRTERVMPSGIPVLPGQPISRFKKAAADNVLYQVGVGLFSANAVPPYRSWSQFAPEVAKGIEALLVARDDSEKSLPFAQVSLRYIDAFRSNLTGGREVNEFMRDVFKIRVELPEVLTKNVTPGKSPKPFVIINAPVAMGTLQMSAGEANIGGSLGIVLDTTVATSEPVEPTVAALMHVLDTAHQLIRETFLAMTEPIRSLLAPEQ